MPDIYIPPQLSKLESGLDLLKSFFDNANYPQAKAKVENDIKSFHALNATELQKYQDAKDTIAQNQSLLDAAKDITTQNEKDSHKLKQEREQFESYKKAENEKLAKQREDNAAAAISNKDLYDMAIEAQKDVKGREEALVAAQKAHAQNVAQLEKKKAIIEQNHKDIEDLKAAAVKELAEIRAKKEAIARISA